MGVLASPVLLQGGKLNALLPASPGCQYKHLADIAELAERARRFFLQQRSWLGHVTLLIFKPERFCLNLEPGADAKPEAK